MSEGTTATEQPQKTPENVIRMGVPEYGRFELTGTAEFLGACKGIIQRLTEVLLAEHVRQECEVKGRSIEDVQSELVNGFEDAVSRGMAEPGEMKHVSAKIA